MSVAAELRRIVGDAATLDPPPAHYLVHETERRGLRGSGCSAATFDDLFVRLGRRNPRETDAWA